MSSLYASIIRTSDDDILTEIQVAENYLDNVNRIQSSIGDTKIEEVHMCAIAETSEPTLQQKDLAIKWIKRHL